jgi:hypothetical protein
MAMRTADKLLKELRPKPGDAFRHVFLYFLFGRSEATFNSESGTGPSRQIVFNERMQIGK